jgi:imidazoleglycerol-phosphate dehydratase
MKTTRMSIQQRLSAETNIAVTLTLDGKGTTDILTGVGFLDHMLTLTAFWAGIDLKIACQGDVHVDAHHTVEDVGLTLGLAIADALGDKSGIARVGYGRVPMDEALAEVTVDFSGRPWLEWHGDDLIPAVIVGEEKDIWREFYKSLAGSARCNLHLAFLYGRNGHHLLESAAKSFGIALAQAIRKNGTTIRSTKGSLA